MKTNCTRFILVTLVTTLVIWTISCSGRPGDKSNDLQKRSVSTVAEGDIKLIKMVSPLENEEFRLNDPVKVSVAPERETGSYDSVRVYFDGHQVAVLKSDPWEYQIPAGLTSKTGRKPVRVVAHKGKQIQTVTRFVIVYSDVRPERKGFKVIHTFPHDQEAFTQGLFYDKGLLFEGTGQQAGSSLREVELETGRVLRQLNLETSLFGEGITLYDGRIYQVTWQNKVGFVYSRDDFSVINRIYYSTEGWGLATIDDRIVMSDGTNVIYFFDPGTFTVESRIEVYDNEKKVDQLNELEYINGEIWANIWQTDLIARIDPVSGKVNSYVDLSSLYPETDRRTVNADVLNGIAFDKTGNRVFVTGKRWPKLYEIRVNE